MEDEGKTGANKIIGDCLFRSPQFFKTKIHDNLRMIFLPKIRIIDVDLIIWTFYDSLLVWLWMRKRCFPLYLFCLGSCMEMPWNPWRYYSILRVLRGKNTPIVFFRKPLFFFVCKIVSLYRSLQRCHASAVHQRTLCSQSCHQLFQSYDLGDLTYAWRGTHCSWKVVPCKLKTSCCSEALFFSWIETGLYWGSNLCPSISNNKVFFTGGGEQLFQDLFWLFLFRFSTVRISYVVECFGNRYMRRFAIFPTFPRCGSEKLYSYRNLISCQRTSLFFRNLSNFGFPWFLSHLKCNRFFSNAAPWNLFRKPLIVAGTTAGLRG